MSSSQTARLLERAGVPWSSAVAIVHNIYWLTAAEIGYFGLVALVLLWLQITIAGLRCSWKTTGILAEICCLGLA